MNVEEIIECPYISAKEKEQDLKYLENTVNILKNSLVKSAQESVMKALQPTSIEKLTSSDKERLGSIASDAVGEFKAEIARVHNMNPQISENSTKLNYLLNQLSKKLIKKYQAIKEKRCADMEK